MLIPARQGEVFDALSTQRAEKASHQRPAFNTNVQHDQSAKTYGGGLTVSRVPV